MKKLLRKIWAWIAETYQGIVGGTKKYVPIAIKIVEAMKKVMDSPVDDVVIFIVTSAIPGDADDKAAAKVKAFVEKWLPKFLLELRIIEGVANIPNLNDQLQAILNEVKKLSPETQGVIWHGFASLAIEKLSDGELSWSDAVALSEYFYKNVYNK